MNRRTFSKGVLGTIGAAIGGMALGRRQPAGAAGVSCATLDQIIAEIDAVLPSLPPAGQLRLLRERERVERLRAQMGCP